MLSWAVPCRSTKSGLLQEVGVWQECGHHTFLLVYDIMMLRPVHNMNAHRLALRLVVYGCEPRNATKKRNQL